MGKKNKGKTEEVLQMWTAGCKKKGHTFPFASDPVSVNVAGIGVAFR